MSHILWEIVVSVINCMLNLNIYLINRCVFFVIRFLSECHMEMLPCAGVKTPILYIMFYFSDRGESSVC